MYHWHRHLCSHSFWFDDCHRQQDDRARSRPARPRARVVHGCALHGCLHAAARLLRRREREARRPQAVGLRLQKSAPGWRFCRRQPVFRQHVVHLLGRGLRSDAQDWHAGLAALGAVGDAGGEGVFFDCQPGHAHGPRQYFSLLAAAECHAPGLGHPDDLSVVRGLAVHGHADLLAAVGLRGLGRRVLLSSRGCLLLPPAIAHIGVAAPHREPRGGRLVRAGSLADVERDDRHYRQLFLHLRDQVHLQLVGQAVGHCTKFMSGVGVHLERRALHVLAGGGLRHHDRSFCRLLGRQGPRGGGAEHGRRAGGGLPPVLHHGHRGAGVRSRAVGARDTDVHDPSGQ
mmetsp:Transcript_122362/g.391471  ORF Transcript_122362/g.391471 Transcript_122362/m.391471 type:complete len:343 (-) Transcript_122362:1881-2909(-)